MESNCECVQLRVEVRKYLLYFCFIFRKEILDFTIVNVLISLSALLNEVALNDLGYSTESYDESPGVSEFHKELHLALLICFSLSLTNIF